MIKPFKEREINYNKPVLVYRNLNCKNDEKLYSIKQGNYVVAHTSDLILKDVIFKISKAGQIRARRTKQRNVHAFAKGYVVQGEIISLQLSNLAPITYNPFKNDYFVYKMPITDKSGRLIKDGEIPVGSANYVLFEKSGVVVTKG